ncbi:V-set and immunoglobulin domain-containing protein 2 [Liparis tanakae]|nr:V-set and immunoglobulin domain-containing protein 2 [Liparis tanakae]
MINNPPESADPGIGELELSVQAPPSLPVCRWDGGVELGGRVTLSCSVLEGEPSSVQMVNVSSQTSGLYRCSARNLLGTEHCYVNLSLYPRPDSSSGLLQAALLTLSMSAVLTALLALVLWLHRTGQDGRRREGREEEEEEEEESYNEIRCTPSLMKRSFV